MEEPFDKTLKECITVPLGILNLFQGRSAYGATSFYNFNHSLVIVLLELPSFFALHKSFFIMKFKWINSIKLMLANRLVETGFASVSLYYIPSFHY